MNVLAITMVTIGFAKSTVTVCQPGVRAGVWELLSKLGMQVFNKTWGKLGLSFSSLFPFLLVRLSELYVYKHFKI